MNRIELGAPFLDQEDKDALTEVIDSAWITMGPRVAEFETAFATIQEMPHAVAVGSATAALQLTLEALGIGPGDEVLVPSMSFVATANVVVHTGATPVFVDIEGEDLPHISLGQAEAKVTDRTRACVLMHYGGYLMDVQPWAEWCRARSLFLIEDAAHIAGLPGPGLHSHAAAFSFFTNKNMTTAEGGMVLTRDAELATRVRHLRSHGMTASTLDRALGRATSYDVVAFGHNFRLDEFRGALGLAQLRRLPVWNQRRSELTTRYRKLLELRTPQVSIPFPDGRASSFHILPALLPPGTDRALVVDRLKDLSIQTSVHYPPIHRFTAYRSRFGDLHLPHTESFADRQLTLPLHPQLSDDDVEYVTESLAAALEGAEL